MLKKLMLIGGLVICVVTLFGTNANAQFDGWGWFGFSAIEGKIKTIKTPNPTGNPSQITVTADVSVQIACFNPASKGVFNGVAFHRTVTGSTPLGIGNITDTKAGDAETSVFLSLDQFEIPANCPNPGWQPISGSAMALNFSGTVTWCLVDKKTGQLNCSQKGLLDQEGVTCILDTTNPQNQRNPDGTAPHTAVFTCPQPQ
jgi:hypothetical protein